MLSAAGANPSSVASCNDVVYIVSGVFKRRRRSPGRRRCYSQAPQAQFLCFLIFFPSKAPQAQSYPRRRRRRTPQSQGAFTRIRQLSLALGVHEMYLQPSGRIVSGSSGRLVTNIPGSYQGQPAPIRSGRWKRCPDRGIQPRGRQHVVPVLCCPSRREHSPGSPPRRNP